MSHQSDLEGVPLAGNESRFAVGGNHSLPRAGSRCQGRGVGARGELNLVAAPQVNATVRAGLPSELQVQLEALEELQRDEDV